MEIINKLQWRYATKAFEPNKIVPTKKMDIIKQAFNLTATSFGLQPIKLIVIKDKELQEQLLPYSFNQKQIVQASHVLILCIQTNIDKEFVTNYFDRVHKIRNTPKDILKPFEEFLINDFENKSQQDIENWAINQAYLALGNLMTVCALEDIDSCPMEGFMPEKYDEFLGLKKQGLKSVLLLPIGYRDEKDMFSDFKKVRKHISDSIIEL